MEGCDENGCVKHGVVMEKIENMKDTCKEHRDELRTTKESLWNAVNSKLSTKMFLSLFGIIVAVIVGFMGYTTTTVRAVEKVVIEVQIQNTTILEKLNELKQGN